MISYCQYNNQSKVKYMEGFAMYANRIKIIRKEKGITLTNLAKLSGLSVGYLCHLEKGTRKNPSIEVMNNIARVLNRSIAEVFFE